MWNRLPWRRPYAGDPLLDALVAPDPDAVRLGTDLLRSRPDERGRSLLVTSATDDPAAAMVAGNLAAITCRQLGQATALVDLRPPTARTTATPAGTAAADSELRIVRPDDRLLADIQQLRARLSGLPLRDHVRIILTGATLTPGRPAHDPATWAAVCPHALMACSEGAASLAQVTEARLRLQRADIEVTGGVLVSGRARRHDQEPLAYHITSLAAAHEGAAP